MVDETIWKKFINHAIVRQQLAEITVQETIRKLKYLEKHGINLMTDKEELKKQVYDFFSKKLQEGASHSALNHYVKALNRWCKFREIDIKFKKYRETAKPRRIPLTNDLKKLMDTCKNSTPIDKRDRTIIFTLYKMGLRAMELCNLNLDDIDWINGTMTIRGKGGKIRYLPIPHDLLKGKNVPSLLNYVKYWRLDTDKKALFTTQKGRLSPVYLRSIIKKRARQAGIPWIHPHSLRHYYATNLLRAGVNIRVVQELLGHTDIKTTGIYLHIIETDMRNAVENPNLEDPLKLKPKRKKQHPPKNRHRWLKNKIKSVAGLEGIKGHHRIYFGQHMPDFSLCWFKRCSHVQI